MATSGWTETVTTRRVPVEDLPPHIREKIQQQREPDAVLLSADNQSAAIEQKRLRVSEATVREALARSDRKIRTVSELSDGFETLSESDVFERVRKIIVKQLEVEGTEVQPNSRLVEDLGADSLDIVEMVMAVEEEFNIEIRDEVAEHLITVGDAVRVISRGGD